MGIVIEDLDPTITPSLQHRIPAMRDGETVQLTLEQVKELVLEGVTAFAKTLLDDANADAALTTLGVSAYAKSLLDDANAGAAQSTLGISTFVKTLLDDASASAVLTTLGVSTFIQGLLDDANASAAQTTLGISAFVKTLLDDTDASTFLSTLGVSAFVKTLLDDADGNAFWTTLGANWNNASTGYFKLPNGFMLQWGIVNQAGAADFTLSWGISFPNAIRTALAMPLFNNTSVSELATVNLSNLGVSNCSCRPRYVASGGTVNVTSGMPIAWIAIGY